MQFLVNRLVHHHLPPAEQKLWKNCCLNCNNPPTYNLSEKNCFRLKLNGIKAATATAAPPPPTLGDIYRLLTAATLASLHHHLRSSHAADKMVTGSRDVHTTTGERYRHWQVHWDLICNHWAASIDEGRTRGTIADQHQDSCVSQPGSISNSLWSVFGYLLHLVPCQHGDGSLSLCWDKGVMVSWV